MTGPEVWFPPYCDIQQQTAGFHPSSTFESGPSRSGLGAQRTYARGQRIGGFAPISAAQPSRAVSPKRTLGGERRMTGLGRSPWSAADVEVGRKADISLRACLSRACRRRRGLASC